VTTGSLVLRVVCLAVLAGCGVAGAAPPPDVEVAPPPDLDEPPSRPEGTTRMRMQSHFEDLRLIERLLLAGRLDEARDRATAIAFDRADSELPAWAPYIARMRQAASALAQADSLREACRAETRLARECATCHQASAAMPTFVVPDRPSGESTLAARMARHQWAADRLWEGLVGLSDEAWRDGLDVLAAAPLPATAIAEDRAQLPRFARYARDLQRVARRGVAARTPAARATAYADLLTVCSGCHARLESEW
jgi:cytochrome c553